MLRRDGAKTYFAYLEREHELVHNANMLAAAVLVRAGRLLDRTDLVETAAATIETTVSAQRADGSWPYAAAGGHEWVDNFHTAYVLEALAECVKVLPDLQAPLDRGLEFWSNRLFLPDGTPRYSTERVYPLDAHCYADAVETWLAVGDVERAEHAARLLVERMLAPAGFVYVQEWRWFRSRVPLIRWSTAPSFCALAGVLAARTTTRTSA
jgi:hypothetical protein